MADLVQLDATKKHRRLSYTSLITVLVLALVTLVCVQRGMYEAASNWDVGSGDQGGYLRLALKVASGRGFTNDNYRPLLSFILQPITTRDWQFFTNAKLTNIALAALSLVVVYLVTRQLFGPVPALLTAAALSLNTQYIEYSARTEPEILLTVLFFTAWGTWTLGFSSPRWWLLAGPLAGLAYMAKGTGQFLLIGFLLVPLLRFGPRALANRYLWLLIGLYFLVASPFLIDRAQHYGSPFYDFNSSHAIWYNSWQDRYLSPDGTQTTAQTYFATHTWSQTLQRLRDGALRMPSVWEEALRLSPSPLGTIITFVAIALSLLGLWLAFVRHTVESKGLSRLIDATWTTGALFLPMYLFFGWYLPVISSPRFELPLAPIMYSLLACLAWIGLRHLLSDRGTLLVPTCIAGVALILVLTNPWVSPSEIARSDREQNSASIAIFEYLVHHEQLGENVIWGPGNLGTWPFYGLVSFEPIPSTVEDWEAMHAFMEKKRAREVILGTEMVKRRPKLLSPYFRVEGDRIAFETLPPGWTLLYAYPQTPCTYCIFRVETVD